MLYSLVDEIAERQGKAINVEISGDKILLIPTSTQTSSIAPSTSLETW